MDNRITLGDAKKEYNRILDKYETAGFGRYVPDGCQREWFSETIEQLEMLSTYAGDSTYLFLDEIPPNMIASQPDISLKKYDGLKGMIEEVGWDIFPVISIYMDSLDYPKKYRYVATKGHTRNRVFVDAGKKKIPALIIESNGAIRKAENIINLNMTVMRNKGFYLSRHPRISDLPLNGDWDNTGILLGPEDYSYDPSVQKNRKRNKSKHYRVPSWKTRNGD